MAKGEGRLFQAFHEDHALLGAGFFEISKHLRSGDIEAARTVAQRLNAEAGAHIGFEEGCFYPALARLSGYDVEPLYEEHQLGRDVIAKLQALRPEQVITDNERLDLLDRSEAMETHIAECGALFEAMGRMPASQQDDLCDALMQWRWKKPAWLELGAAGSTKDAITSR